MTALKGYVNLEMIHESEHSTVFRGYTKENSPSPVILKLVHSDLSDPSLSDRIQNEYRILKENQISGLPEVMGLEKVLNGYLLVFRDFGGVSLDQILAQRNLEIPEVYQIAIGVLKVLGEIHSHGVLHRDIKPGNLIYNQERGSVQIIDFGLASKIEESQAKPEGLIGALHYMAPEQTGRVNRNVDQRSDFYSFGVSLYECLTGQVPFHGLDAMELVHSHIAKNARPILELRPSTPVSLARIVEKLMNKNPEDRYQDAYSILEDIERSYSLFKNGENDSEFELGGQVEMLAPKKITKIYGRDRELKSLIEEFQLAKAGDTGLSIIVGEPGSGKSYLVEGLLSQLRNSNYWLANGKFGQFRNEQPYAAIIEAFDRLVKMLLAAPEEILVRIMSSLQDSLGENGGVLVELLPSAAQLLGKTDNPEPLGPSETHERLQNVMLAFLKCFCKEDYTTVLIIDDLQWSDYGSRSFLQKLTLEEPIPNLHLIMTARPEVLSPENSAHAFLKYYQEKGGECLELNPLQYEDVTELLADVLSMEQGEVEPLAEILSRKTGGNAFFIDQLVQALYRANILTPNNEGHWSWDRELIEKHPSTSNVIELLTANLQKLSSPTQKTLRFASCFGNEFCSNRLLRIMEMSSKDLGFALSEAIDNGFIKEVGTEQDGSDSVFAFVHDRVQEACYKFLSADEQKGIHKKIGIDLISNPPDGGILRNIFSITEHLNHAVDLIESPRQRLLIAKLNLAAAKRAERTSNYEISKQLSKAGLGLVTSYLEESNEGALSSLKLKLSLALAKAHFFTDEKKQCEELIRRLLAETTNSRVRADICLFAAMLFGWSALDHHTSLRFARRGLREIGEFIPKKPGFRLILLLLNAWWQLAKLGYRGISNLPVRRVGRDERLFALAMAAATQDQKLVLYYNLIILNRAIRLGMTRYSVNSLAVFAMILAVIFERRKFAAKIADAAAKWESGQEKRRDEVHGVMNSVNATFIKPWTSPYLVAAKEIDTSYDVLRELPFVSYPTLYTAIYAFCYRVWGGVKLRDALEECQEKLQLLKTSTSENMKDCALALEAFVKCVLGETDSEATFDWEGFSEEDYERRWKDNEDAITIGWLSVFKIWSLYLCNKFADIDVHILRAKAYLKQIQMGFGRIVVEFYYPMILIERARREQRKLSWKESRILAGSLRTLNRWRKQNEGNFSSLYFILHGEYSRYRGKEQLASQSFERAIRAAHDSKNLHIEALAYERAGYFQRSRGESVLEAFYLSQAASIYMEWGAHQKAKELAGIYSGSISRPSNSNLAGVSKASIAAFRSTHQNHKGAGEIEKLDVISILKSSQAIAEEIEVNPLVKKLTTIIAENAGAERGVLLSIDGEDLLPVAEVHFSEGVQASLSSQFTSYPSTVVNYVRRTGEGIVIEDMSQENIFRNDPYFGAVGAKSILCIPIISKSELNSIIYLEHRTSTSVFTADRVEGIKMLLGQAAISLENAKLFQMSGEKARMEHELETARLVQETLLPPSQAQIGSVSIHGQYESATECGGDWWAYQEIGDRVFIWVGDVLGHGAPAALVTSAACSAVEIISGFNDISVSEAMSILNNAIWRVASGRLNMPLAVAAIDKRTGGLTYGLAAHLSPLLLRKRTFDQVLKKGERLRRNDLECFIGINRLPLGEKKNVEFTSGQIQLEPGDILLFYTDGAIDTVNPANKPIGEGAFQRLFFKAVVDSSSFEDIMPNLQMRLSEYRQGAALVDDTTIVICKYLG